MIFWIILILFILCGIYTLLTGVFAYDELGCTHLSYSSDVTLALGVVILICLMIMGMARLDESKDRLVHQQQYQTLLYKANHYENLQNKFDFEKESIVDQINNYNVKFATYEARSNNKWIGIFYGRDLYENCGYIDLETLNIKD